MPGAAELPGALADDAGAERGRRGARTPRSVAVDADRVGVDLGR